MTGVYLLNKQGQAFHKNHPDAFGLDGLKRSGADMTQPHMFEFYLYFLSEADAQQAADRFAPDGYAARVSPAALGNKWLCLLSRQAVPSDS